MDRLIALHTGNGFFGSEYFRHELLGEFEFDSARDNGHDDSTPRLKDEFGIDAVGVPIPDFSVKSLEILEESYSKDFDAILVQWPEKAFRIYEAGVFKDTPLFVGGHTVNVWDDEKWFELVNSEREIYVFTGSARAARAFNEPGNETVKVILAPIMGRSPREESHFPNVFIEEPKKEYDIGFFSSLRIEKRPHRVLETANNVAKALDQELSVWIAGYELGDRYLDLVKRLCNSEHYSHINASFEGRMRSKELFRRVQKTRVMYLPLLNPKETTCYAAWEIVGYDVPLVTSDWAGHGEAVRHSRHPLSNAVPIQSASSFNQIFPDSVRREYQDSIREITRNNSPRLPSTTLMIDEEAAQSSLINALTTDMDIERELDIPDRVHSQSTFRAMKDIINNSLPEPDNNASGQETSLDIFETGRGYAILRDSPVRRIPYQTSLYTNPPDTSAN